MSSQFSGRQKHFKAGRHIAGKQASLGAGVFARCVLGRSRSPDGFGKAFAKTWMPHIIDFSPGFEKSLFQSAFLRWTFLLQI